MSTAERNAYVQYERAVRQGNAKQIRALIDSGVKPPERMMLYALIRKHPELLPLLREAGCDPNDENGFHETALGRAVNHYPLEVVKMLLDFGANPNKESLHLLPLVHVGSRGKIEYAKLLLDRGADPNCAQWNGVTPLYAALQREDYFGAKLLLQAGADPMMGGPDGKRIVEFALSLDRPDLVDLLKTFLIDRTAKDTLSERKKEEIARILVAISSGKAPRSGSPIELLLDSIKRNDAPAFGEYLASGVDINKRDRFGWNPLECAVDVGSIDFVHKLIKAGANVNAHKEGVTALDMAVNKERPDIAEILVKAGAKPKAFTRNGPDPFWTVCTSGDLRLAKLFLGAGADPNSANDPGRTALMNAVGSRGSVELVGLLISKGAEVERADASGWTALFYAVQGGLAITYVQRKFSSGAKLLTLEPIKTPPEDKRLNEIITLLLAKGADINRRDKEGRTPLTYATSTGIARLLISAGAKLDSRDKKGRDASYWLKKNGVPLENDETRGRSKPRQMLKLRNALTKRRRA